VTDVPAAGADPGVPRRRRGGGASSFTRSIFGAFARGTGLIAVALVIGIVHLQWSDASTDVAAGGQVPVAGTPVAPPETTTTTTVPAGPKAPGEVAVLVLNATGKNQQAKPMADRLAVVGYRTLTPGNATRRPDSVVLCKPGLDREAAALVAATGLPASTAPLDATAAAGIEGAAEADCVVIIGSR
jgi:hypothetical protein